MKPMSSENASPGGGQAGESAGGCGRRGTQRAQAFGVAAMNQARRARAREAGFGARAGALAAMEAAAPVLHRRLAAHGAGAGAGAAARGGEVIAGAVAVA